MTDQTASWNRAIGRLVGSPTRKCSLGGKLKGAFTPNAEQISYSPFICLYVPDLLLQSICIRKHFQLLFCG